MSKKPTPKPDDPEHYKRFRKTAEEVEASDDLEDFDREFKKVTRQKEERG